MFRDYKMIPVLKGLATNEKLPPIEVNRENDGYIYKLYDGVHRYYAAAALGYSYIPVIVKDWSFDDFKDFLAEETARAIRLKNGQ